ATTSPAKPTISLGIAGCGGALWSGVTGQALGILPCWSARSAPVSTATTPVADSASETAMLVMRARATGLHHAQVQHAGQGHVVGVAAAAGDQARILLARARPADLRAGLFGDRHRETSDPAACCTAATMF